MRLFGYITKLFDFIYSCLISGLFVILPFLLTSYIVHYCVELFGKIIGLGLSYYWIIFIVFLIFLCGFFAQNSVVTFIKGMVEFFIMKIPGIGFLYVSFRDFTSVFARRNGADFNTPVLVYINGINGGVSDIKKIIFITNKKVKFINTGGNIGDENEIKKDNNDEDVAVFIPQSFSLTAAGELILVPRKNLRNIDPKFDKASVFRFVVSGGFIDVLEKKVN